MTTVAQLPNISNQIVFSPRMNSEAVKVGGEQWDRGVIHRAIAVARALCSAGIWNGQDEITICDPAVTFNKLFGFLDQPVTGLVAGVDYRIEGQA